MNLKKEEHLQTIICRYISLQYPHILFNIDLSGVKLPIGIAKKISRLRSNRAFPDMVIYAKKGNYGALFLELKRETPYRKDGKLKKNKHLEEQNVIIERLKEEGYAASFVWNFDQAKKIIDDYLKL